MTSEINVANIDITYPVAGQDNDSQGFRDNFSEIQSALLQAKAEIQDLQDKAVLRDKLTVDPTPTNFNDLLGNSITNGKYSNLRGEFAVIAQNHAFMIDAPVQKFTGTGNLTISIAENSGDIPHDNEVVSTRIHLVGPVGTGTNTVTLVAGNGGSLKKEADFPASLVINADTELVIEVWTFTASSSKKLYVRYLGEY